VSEDGECLSQAVVVVSHDLRCVMRLRGNTQRYEPSR
jgi:hypothetical protein